MSELANAAYSTLASGIDSDDTSLSVASGHGARFPASNFYICVYDSMFRTFAEAFRGGYGEIMLCSSRSTDTLTVTRAKGGTTALSFNTTGRTYRVELNFIKENITSQFLMTSYSDLETGTFYTSMGLGVSASSTEANAIFYMPDGTYSVLGLVVTARKDGGITDYVAVATVRKNGSDTSMTATATNTNSNVPTKASDVDSSHAFTFTTGEYVTVKVVVTEGSLTGGDVFITLLFRKDA